MLKQALAKNRNRQFLYALALVLLGLGLVIIPQSYHPNILIMFDVIGFSLFIAGLYISIINIRLLNISNSKVIKLTEQPEKVVWIYHEVLISMPFGIKTLTRATVYLNLDDGKYDFFQIPPEKAEQFLDHLRQVFPDATFGHSVEKEQLYRANPNLLRKSAEY